MVIMTHFSTDPEMAGSVAELAGIVHKDVGLSAEDNSLQKTEITQEPWPFRLTSSATAPVGHP